MTRSADYNTAQPAARKRPPSTSLLRRAVLWLLAACLISLVISLAGFIVWAETAPGPAPNSLGAQALTSDATVKVETGRYLVFRPQTTNPQAGFILYPGGRVRPEAYAAAAHTIAAQGYLVVVPAMPLNMAVFASDRAQSVMAAFPTVHTWAVGGHSLGGAMAARFTRRHPDLVGALVLWAAYPAATDSLAKSTIPTASISGALDGLATPTKIAASRPLMPANTIWVPIAGGNHAQFGWYGAQKGDHPATISRESQQEQVVAATLGILGRLPPAKS